MRQVACAVCSSPLPFESRVPALDECSDVQIASARHTGNRRRTPVHEQQLGLIVTVQEPAQVLGDDVRRARLDQHVRNPGITNPVGLVEVEGMSGNRQNRDGARLRGLLECAAELEAVESGDGQISEDGIRRGGLRLLERLVTVMRLERAKPGLCQGLAVIGPCPEVVLNDEHQRLV